MTKAPLPFVDKNTALLQLRRHLYRAMYELQFNNPSPVPNEPADHTNMRSTLWLKVIPSPDEICSSKEAGGLHVVPDTEAENREINKKRVSRHTRERLGKIFKAIELLADTEKPELSRAEICKIRSTLHGANEFLCQHVLPKISSEEVERANDAGKNLDRTVRRIVCAERYPRMKKPEAVELLPIEQRNLGRLVAYFDESSKAVSLAFNDFIQAVDLADKTLNNREINR